MKAQTTTKKRNSLKVGKLQKYHGVHCKQLVAQYHLLVEYFLLLLALGLKVSKTK